VLSGLSLDLENTAATPVVLLFLVLLTLQVQVLHYNIFNISTNNIINNHINLFLLINADKTRDRETASR
jgi:hypothetical protein